VAQVTPYPAQPADMIGVLKGKIAFNGDILSTSFMLPSATAICYHRVLRRMRFSFPDSRSIHFRQK